MTDKIRKNTRSRIKAPILFAALGFTIAGSAVLLTQTPAAAYLTDHGSLVNLFTQGTLEIIPSEPDWPGDQEAAAPGDVIPKNPMIQAKKGCEVPAYVYMQVKIPYGMVTKVNDDGTLYDKDDNGKRTARLHQLLTFGSGEPVKAISEGKEYFLTGENYKADALSLTLDTNHHGLTVHASSGLQGWTLIHTESTDAAQGDPPQVQGYVVYTYSYNSMLADTELASVKEKYKGYISKGTLANQTVSLFDKVRMINCIEGQLEGAALQIPVKAFAIQAPHTGSDEMKDDNGLPETPADIIKYAETAYKKYAGQNADNGTASVSAGNFAVIN